ncbi:MAG: glycosyltransferase [Chloroflexi bacterium]|nr:glycosyltransferase [Chloroflexota bacterium]
MNRSHWLFVTPFYKPAHVYGGPTYSISTLCETLVKMGSLVTVFTTNANGSCDLPFPPGVPQDIEGVQVYYFRRDHPGSYFYSKQLTSACYQKIRLSSFDVVYIASNWGYPFIPSCWASILNKVPYIISPRASFKRNTWRGKFIKKITYHLLAERHLIQKASLLHYTTKLEADQSSWLRLRTPKVIIPNPINIQEFNLLPSKGIFRNKFKIAIEKRIVLILGRIDPDKGLDLALQSIKKVLQQIPDVMLVIAGPEENNYLQSLKKWADKLDITNHIVFTGLLGTSQRLEALMDADLIFSPSRSENFGMSIVEAMACGIPVIVSNQVGVSDYIDTERAGLVVPLDPEKMADGIVKMLNDSLLCLEYSQRGKLLVHDRFSDHNIAMKYLQIIDRFSNPHNP